MLVEFGLVGKMLCSHAKGVLNLSSLLCEYIREQFSAT